MSRLPRSVLSALGVLAVLVVLGAGALFALPLYLGAQSADAHRAQVASTNALQQTQLELLKQQSAHRDEVAAEVAALRAQIPDAAHLDDAVALAARAADAADVRIESLTVGAPEPFHAQPADPADKGDEVSDAASNAQQVLVTVRVTGESARHLFDFVDGLRTGERLAAIGGMIADTTGETGLEMTVEMRVFFETPGTGAQDE